jgi:hypothetical protein
MMPKPDDRGLKKDPRHERRHAEMKQRKIDRWKRKKSKPVILSDDHSQDNI